MTRIKNTTSIPNELLEEIIAFVRPKRIGQVSYTFWNRHDGHFSGTTDTFSKVHVSVDTKGIYPRIHDVRGQPQVRNSGKMVDGKIVWTEYTRRSNGGYLPSLLLSLEEALVHIIAHELRHVWQQRHEGSRRGKVWGARGNYSERDADAYAIKMQRKWRRRNGIIHHYPHAADTIQWTDKDPLP